MSAREELFESMTPWDRRPAPGEAEAVNALLDTYRAEVLREAAEKVRQGEWGYSMVAFAEARKAGPGSILDYAQSAIADFITP